ncbi:MAG: hypothetical protein Q7S06_02255 [Nanoarchaeota archaeon]|nr:hypothetical protein [Nanoarchaeota archaeon]
MKTITQPKIQELESKEDLELLVSGDLVNVDFEEYKGYLTYYGRSNRFLMFKGKLYQDRTESIVYYNIELLDVQDNKVIKRSQ